jgi:hypothetical protein
MEEKSIPRELIVGRWTHAHEEDSQSEVVYRHPDAPLPPSRGRKSFELKADGALIERMPGPADKTQKSAGRWSLDPNGAIKFFTKGSDEPTRTLEILSVDSERLVVRK